MLVEIENSCEFCEVPSVVNENFKIIGKEFIKAYNLQTADTYKDALTNYFLLTNGLQ